MSLRSVRSPRLISSLRLLQSSDDIAVIIVMYLNLKSKRLAEGTAANFNKANGQARSHREHQAERPSKEQKEIKSTRQQHNMHKKQTASTALTSAQPSNHSYGNVSHHFVLPRPQSLDKDTKDLTNRSYQKIDSSRNEKVSKLYRKLKKYDTEDHHVLAEEAPSPKAERPKSKHHLTIKHPNRREVISNFANNYIAITEPDESIERRRDKTVLRDNSEGVYQMLDVLNEVFDREGPTISSARTKFRSKSSRDIDMMNHSLEKEGNRSRPKTNHNNKQAHQILIQEQPSRQQTISHEEEQSLHALMEQLVRNIGRVSTKIDDMLMMNHDKRQGHKFKAFLREMELVMLEVYEKCVRTMSSAVDRYEKSIERVVEEEYQLQLRCEQLEDRLSREKQKNDILLRNLQQVTIKSLYSSAFMGELSDKVDLHSILTRKIEYEAVKNGYITSGTSRRGSSHFDSERDNTFAMEGNEFMDDSMNFTHSEVVRPQHQ